MSPILYLFLQDSDSTPYVAPPVAPFPFQILAPGPVPPALQMGPGKVGITAALTMPPVTQVRYQTVMTAYTLDNKFEHNV